MINKYKIFYSLKIFDDNSSMYTIDSIQSADNVHLVESVKYNLRENNITYNSEEFAGANILFKTDIDKIVWKITKNDTVDINGFNSYEAHSEQLPNVKIWFTEDLPVGYGPSIYHNAPGFVVKYQNEYEDTVLLSVKKIKLTPYILNEKQKMRDSVLKRDFMSLGEFINKKKKFNTFLENSK
jgi:GLPGLI family protein